MGSFSHFPDSFPDSFARPLCTARRFLVSKPTVSHPPSLFTGAHPRRRIRGRYCSIQIDLLRRSRYTKTQTRLRGAAKTRNVADAFRLDASRSVQLQSDGVRHLLLVDDVLTSGSTLAACAAPLRAAGFRISCATLAFAG